MRKQVAHKVSIRFAAVGSKPKFLGAAEWNILKHKDAAEPLATNGWEWDAAQHERALRELQRLRATYAEQYHFILVEICVMENILSV